MLELREAGISGPTRFDFDRGVATLARTIEARLNETVEVLEPLPQSPPKGQHYARKPKYTLRELVLDAPEPDDPDAPMDVDDALAHLPAGLL